VILEFTSKFKIQRTLQNLVFFICKTIQSLLLSKFMFFSHSFSFSPLFSNFQILIVSSSIFIIALCYTMYRELAVIGLRYFISFHSHKKH
jgi:hypothetical protein